MDPLTEMSAKEEEAVYEFRERVRDLIPGFKNDFLRHDLGLLRFIRARELNLKKSEDMLRMHMDWRRKNHVDEILSRDFGNFHQEYPLKLSGRDREGYLVVTSPIGKWDFRAAVDARMKDEFVQFVVQWFERAIEIFSKITTESKYYSQASIVFDFHGFAYRQLASTGVISMLIELIQTFEANYPEILRVVWVINAPAIFNILWGIIKPFLTERTTSKIRIFGNDRNKWREDILAMINEDNLPSAYGGANTSCPNYTFKPDIDVTSLSPCFGKYPVEDMKQVVVGAGQLYTVEVNASVGLEIHWNFKTHTCDIMFHVDFEDVEDIIEPCRVDSHVCVQKGRITCEKAGRYTLVFDNSYSSFKRKSLRYIVWTS